jgi:hypothetical protein
LITSEILASIQARLVGTAAITALVPVGNMGDYLPQETTYPHLQYDLNFESMQVKQEDSQIVDLQINIWTEHKGSRKCMDIADAVRTAFDGVPITIASANGFGCTYETMDHFQEPEGNVYRCSMVFNLMMSAL